MSFVYAEKNFINQEKAKQKVNIFSETKTTLIGAVDEIWDKKEIAAITKYGFVKSVIIGPTCCISFAGNNTIHAQKLLKWIFDKSIVSDEELLTEALRLHKNAPKDEIEFIICSADSGQPIISCIKNGKLDNDVSSAWIGSPFAFRKMQEIRQQTKASTTDITLFSRAIDECGDDSVGGFVIKSTFDGERFFYPERLESSVEKKQIVKPGECLRLFDTAENGGFTIHFRESAQDVIIDFLQKDYSVVYSANFRYKSEKSNECKEHLMIPLIFCTSTNKCL